MQRQLRFEYVAPAPVLEYIAPTPAVSFVAPSQQLRPAYSAAAVTTGVNLDADVVGSASQVVGSLPHGEVFAAPVFHQVHQVPLAGGEIPENLALPGARPGVLKDPAPQGAVTVGYVAAPVPLLVQPVLGGGNTLDAAAVQFLLAQSLLQRQRDEEEAAQRFGEGGGGGEGEKGAEGEVRGKDAGGQPLRPRRYRHAC